MKIAINSDDIVVKIEGWETVWSLKKELSLPLAQIKDISWSNKPPELNGVMAIRLPGTSIPTLFYAGSFLTKTGWEFWYLKLKQSGELIIELSAGRYKKVRLSVSKDKALIVRQAFNNYVNTKNIA